MMVPPSPTAQPFVLPTKHRLHNSCVVVALTGQVAPPSVVWRIAPPKP
jgi:hypothetical protein